jgi:exosortase/archaeosortase family protein
LFYNCFCYKFGFQIYGGAGKALLFSSIAFILLIWRKKKFPILKPWTNINILWLAGSIILLLSALRIINKLIYASKGLIVLPILAHVCIILSVLFLLCFSFGLQNLIALIKIHKRELLLSLGMAALFIVFLYAVYALWTVLASLALKSDKFLLKLVDVPSVYVPPQSLFFSKFSVTISKYCSGIDSTALFASLYALVGILDWQRFNHRKYEATFLPALLILFGFNIIRIFLLIMGGYYINPQIAFSLFHTYAGMVFFIFYSLVFWALTYKWMLNKNLTETKATQLPLKN